MSEFNLKEKCMNRIELEWKRLGEIAEITIGEFVHKKIKIRLLNILSSMVEDHALASTKNTTIQDTKL